MTAWPARMTRSIAVCKRATDSAPPSDGAARDRGALKVEYLGVRKVKETGDRLCWALHRTNDKPEDDGIMDGMFYFDKENWLQTGVVLKGEEGKLIGDYMFRDVQLNPKFKPGQFTREALLDSGASAK